jgi:hypothetical protein
MSRQEPLTWRALEAIKALVQRVRAADGYYTDLGSNVSLEAPSADANVERVVIVSPTDDLSDARASRGLRGPGAISGTMTVVVEYSIPATRTDAMRQAHRGRADLVRVLRDDPALLPARITSLTITGRQILQPEDMPCVITQITLSVGLSEPTPAPQLTP